MIIYVDVLFVINFFITFFLLEVTAKLSKKEAKTVRLVSASAFGGLYSLIILADIPEYLSVFSKAAAAVIILLIAFRFYRVKNFGITLLIFLFSNFVFLGIIAGCCMIFETELIAVNNSTVYFNIGARGLLVTAFFAYIVSCAVVRIYNRSLAKGELYTLEIENCGRKITLFAFSDTGNKLREPFSDYPVIIVKKERAEELIGNSKTRLIPVSTVNNSSLLTAFKPEKITVKTSKNKEVIENAYIALSEDLKSSAYSAIINPEILSL